MISKNGNQPVPLQTEKPKGLEGKVALVVGDREASVQPLVSSLAKKGVDIALACVDEPCEDSIQEEVEAQGRRFLAIRGKINSAAVVEQILDVFGRLDLFIDCSTSKVAAKKRATTLLEVNGNGSGNGRLHHNRGDDQQLALFSNTSLATAAIQALTIG